LKAASYRGGACPFFIDMTSLPFHCISCFFVLQLGKGGNCKRSFVSRSVELDMFFGREDVESDAPHYEPFADDDVEEIVEELVLLDTLYAALKTLAERDRDIIEDIFWDDKTERELKNKYGFKQSKSINKHKHRILKILHDYEGLKKYFK
jgi:hypothetical protein